MSANVVSIPEPDRRELVTAEAEELAARVRMLLPRLLQVTVDPEPISSVVAAAVLLDDVADWLGGDPGPVHRACGARDDSCPVAGR
jgi:hypothetical protein